MLGKIKTFLAVLGLIIFLCAGFYYWGRVSAKNAIKEAAPAVTSQIIVDKISDQSFLVTKTLFLDTKAEITVRDDSGFKGFFVGQKISAQGVVRVDVGEDLRKLSAEDVVIDNQNKKVTVYLSGAEVLDSSIFGDVRIENKKGLWTNVKDLFNDDKSFEYNLSANELIAQANFAAKDKTEFFQTADQSAAQFISYVIGNILPDYTVEVRKK
jgi:hypothetical protein